MQYDNTKDITIKDLKEGKQEFEVVFNYEEGGKTTIKANSQEEAEAKLLHYLEDIGDLQELERECGFDISMRDYYIV